VVPRGGAFARLSLEDLAAPVIKALLADAGLAAQDVDEVICSNALGAGGNPARRIALAAGLPERVAGLTIDRQCVGGLDAILLARALVEGGGAKVVIAGGVESFSRRPLRMVTDPDGGPPQPYHQPPFTPWPEREPHMTAAAAALAARAGISRAAQDRLACLSHAKALTARVRIRAEIVPLLGQIDDAFSRALTPALAARAKVLFGSVTAATAAVAADAAAFVLVMKGEGGLQIVSGMTIGDAPSEPALGAIPAMRAALGMAGCTAQDLQVVELMEAYAVQAIGCAEALGLAEAVLNPGGGALARGHPIGASGAILAVRMFHELVQGRGLAAISAAGGLGTAVVFERS
jgi:acetyl-CoA C-acetyltransferase